MIKNLSIIENFISEDENNYIYEQMSKATFPWFYDKILEEEFKDGDDIWRFQFTHNFYQDFVPQSDFVWLIEPIIKKISPKALIRIKANFGPVNLKPVIGGFHQDYGFKCKTAIYYVNTNNGYTLFEDGTKIESIKNRFVSFDSDTLHTGVSQTDKKERMVVNINYFD
jgi:hypothetical protein